MKSAFFPFVIFLGLFLGATSCKYDATSMRKSIAVSLPPHAAILNEITCDSIDVVTLMHSNANPESFEVTVNDIRAVSDADAYIKAGNLHFEQSLTQRISQSNPDLLFVDASEGIELIYGTHSHGNHVHSVADPHTWTSVPNIKIIAANMLAVVIDVDPANEGFYTANYNRLVARLDSIDSVLSSKLNKVDTKAFLIWHPSLSYFARDYGLSQIAIGQDNKEMTPGQIRDTHNKAIEAGVKVMFIQQNFDARQAENIAKELGIDVVQINPLDSDFLHQFNILADALSQ